MVTNKLVGYTIVFMGLALAAVVLQTFEQVLRPLAIALLLMFLGMPLAKFSKDKGIPIWITFSGLILVVIGLMSMIGSLITVDNFDLAEAIPRYQESVFQQKRNGNMPRGVDWTPNDIHGEMNTGPADWTIRPLFQFLFPK